MTTFTVQRSTGKGAAACTAVMSSSGEQSGWMGIALPKGEVYTITNVLEHDEASFRHYSFTVVETGQSAITSKMDANGLDAAMAADYEALL